MRHIHSYPVAAAEVAALRDIISQANQRPNGWSELCDALARCAGGVGTALLSVEPGARGHGVASSKSLEQVTATYIQDGWYLEDQRQAAIPTMLERGYCFDSDIDSLDVLTKRPFYRDFLQHHDLGGFCGIHFKVGDRDWCASIQFGGRRYSPRDGFLAHIDSIAAQLTAVATQSLRQAEEYWQNLSDTYHDMGCELVPIDPFGEVISADLRPLPQGHRPLPWVAELVTKESLSQLIDTDAQKWLAADDNLPPPGITLPVKDSVVSCVYLNAPASMKFFAFGVAGVLSLSRASKSANPAQVFAKRFGLTPAETKVTKALSIGDETKTIALKLGLSDGTVRQYLKSIYRKCDVKTQHQLVAMVHSAGR